MTKTSAALFAPVAAAVVFLTERGSCVRRLARMLSLALIAFLAMWAMYGFEIGPVPGFALPVPAATHIRFNASKVRYFRKYHGALAGEVLRWYLLGHFALQLGLEAAKWLLGHKRPLRAARMKAYGQVLKSGLKNEQ